MTTKPIGLYVHIPFCVRKCNYCDFCSFDEGNIEWRKDYIDALVDEIESYKDKNISVNTIFFGGGTPSLLSTHEFELIVSKIKENFHLCNDLEFTVEANPGTLNEDKIYKYVSCGVNRLSIGLQSIHNNEQKKLGRIHDYSDFLHSYNLARSFGIDNINVDLMYGIPEQTMESFKDTLRSVCDLSPDHISLYGLIIEEGTPFYSNIDNLKLPNEDCECDMYYFACDYLRNRGFSHYEISNYALNGKACKHNLKYWRCEEYIGIGLSAHSFYLSERFSSSSNPREYLLDKSKRKIIDEIVDVDSASYEYVMLRLRLNEGFSLTEYKKLFNKDFLVGREKTVKSLINEGYIRISNDYLSLTESGFYVSNQILTQLL